MCVECGIKCTSIYYVCCLSNIFINTFDILFQLITPKFPVVVKIGHANQGLGKVSAKVQHCLEIFFVHMQFYSCFILIHLENHAQCTG